MKNLKLALWIFVMWLVQVFFSGYLRIGGVIPEFLYIFVVCVSLLEKKPQRYITVGIVCGVIADAIAAKMPGFNLLIYTCTVFAVVRLGEIIYKDMFLWVIPFAAVFTFFKNTIFYFANKGSLGEIAYLAALKSVIVPVVIYNVVAAVVMMLILKKTAYARNRGSRRR